MNKTTPVIILFFFCSIIFLSACGEDDYDETATSINIPISLSRTLSQGEYLVKITVNVPDFAPISKEQNISIQPGSTQTYDINIDSVPVGSNGNIQVEIFKAGRLLFEGTKNANISSDEENLVPVVVHPVAHELVAIFQVRKLDIQTVEVDASQSYDTHYDIEFAWNWGDGKIMDFSQQPIAEHTYSESGEYIIALTVQNKSFSQEVKSTERRVIISKEGEIRTFWADISTGYWFTDGIEVEFDPDADILQLNTGEFVLRAFWATFGFDIPENVQNVNLMFIHVPLFCGDIKSDIELWVNDEFVDLFESKNNELYSEIDITKYVFSGFNLVEFYASEDCTFGLQSLTITYEK